MIKNRTHMSTGGKIKTVLLNISDFIDGICGVRSEITPRKTLSLHYGNGNFYDAGLHFFKILLDYTKLGRDSSILDVGCGAGRMANPLQYYLTPSGRYEGIDIMPEGIEHCRSHVTPLFPNFNFSKADVYNSYYNPSGSEQPENYNFPFPDGSFDVVFSTSLMTHLRPEAAARYVSETSRVLRPGGASMHTFFVLDDHAEEQVKLGKAVLKFNHRVDGFLTTNLDFVEDAIAIPAATVSAMFADAGLSATVYPASWANDVDPVSFQNIVVARKPG